MTARTTALRRLCLAHPRTAKTIARRGGDDDGIAAILNDAAAMESFLLMAARLTRAEIDSMVAPIIGTEPPHLCTPNEIETAKMVAAYG